jgi:hypothetical protein
MDPIYLPSNQSTSGIGGVISLSTTATYINASAAGSGTLAAGTDGQIKTIMMAVAGNSYAITVSNAGWKTAGNGTLTIPNTIGSAVTLQYINSKWYCIGNNGCSFS